MNGMPATMRHALCLLACLLAASAVAQEVVPPTVIVAAPPQPKPKKVCRSLQVSGSLMPERSCHTAQEWTAIDEGTMRDVNNAANRLININHVQGDVTGSTVGGLARPAGH